MKEPQEDYPFSIFATLILGCLAFAGAIFQGLTFPVPLDVLWVFIALSSLGVLFFILSALLRIAHALDRPKPDPVPTAKLMESAFQQKVEAEGLYEHFKKGIGEGPGK